MKIIAVITDPAQVLKILRHLINKGTPSLACRLTAADPLRPPYRGPPAAAATRRLDEPAPHVPERPVREEEHDRQGHGEQSQEDQPVEAKTPEERCP